MKTLVDTIGSHSVDSIFNSYLGCNAVHSDSDSIASSGSEAIFPELEQQQEFFQTTEPQPQAQQPTKRKRKRKQIDAGDKVERRKMQNRRAAQTSREKKKKYVDDLEQRSTELEAENGGLRAQLLRLLNENALMKKQLPPTSPTATATATATAAAAASPQQQFPPYSAQVVESVPHLPPALPTTPCLASESAVLQLPQQPEASKELNVVPEAVQRFMTICFMVLCAMSNNPTSYPSTKNRAEFLSATTQSFCNPPALLPFTKTTPASYPSTSCSHNLTRMSLESHQDILFSDRPPTQ